MNENSGSCFRGKDRNRIKYLTLDLEFLKEYSDRMMIKNSNTKDTNKQTNETHTE